jgi:hypothetical protein
MVIPCRPMEFISLDIAYMPVDNDGYRYILLVGDLFSKFIDAIPLRDQTAESIVKAFQENWLYVHSNPYFLLSDQGSNVDGDTIRTFCASRRGVLLHIIVKGTGLLREIFETLRRFSVQYFCIAD